MSTTLHLGVVDVAYSDPETEGATTTFEVAERLEREYDVMGVFVGAHKKEITKALTQRYAGIINTVANGGPKPDRKHIPMPKIDSAFRDYLSADEWQSITGRVIMAARMGVSHRFKNADNKFITAKSIAEGKDQPATMVLKKPRGPRPAFIDTGLYSASFRSWLTF